MRSITRPHQGYSFVAAAVLSHRISRSLLARQTIDLVDEVLPAAHRDRQCPTELDEIRAYHALEIEREALKKERDTASKERLAPWRRTVISKNSTKPRFMGRKECYSRTSTA
jgi:ATP-dependent Clp protease ATP-binding subunit ClpB